MGYGISMIASVVSAVLRVATRVPFIGVIRIQDCIFEERRETVFVTL